MPHRTWINALGNVAYAGELPPELGIPFMNILDAETDRLWRKAHRDAKRHAGATTLDGAAADDALGIDSAAGGAGGTKVELRRSALAALAFAGMMKNGGGKGKTNRTDLVIVCDLRAWRRGHAHEGEPCHIIGGGPIPVSLAKQLGRDAFLKAVLHGGTELHTIAHFGRRYSAVLSTALDLGAAPEFNGNLCAAPGCDRRYHLQDDHIDPVANGGLTTTAKASRSARMTTGSRPNGTARPGYSAVRGPGPAARTRNGQAQAGIARDRVSYERQPGALQRRFRVPGAAAHPTHRREPCRDHAPSAR